MVSGHPGSLPFGGGARFADDRDSSATSSLSNGWGIPRDRPEPGTDNHTAKASKASRIDAQRRHHQRAHQREVELPHLDAVDQVATKTAQAGIRRHGRGRDDLQGRGAEAAEDERQRVGCLHTQPFATPSCPSTWPRPPRAGPRSRCRGRFTREGRDTEQHERDRRRNQADPEQDSQQKHAERGRRATR